MSSRRRCWRSTTRSRGKICTPRPSQASNSTLAGFVSLQHHTRCKVMGNAWEKDYKYATCPTKEKSCCYKSTQAATFLSTTHPTQRWQSNACWVWQQLSSLQACSCSLMRAGCQDVRPCHVCFAGAAMENQLMDLAAFKRLEKMPTKIELIATIARLLNQVHSTSTL